MHTQKNNQTLLKKIVIILGLVSLLGGIGIGATLYYRNQETAAILDFNDIRDTDFILATFKRDWYWLVEGDDYSPEYMLKHRASSQEPSKKGNLTIKVAYEGKEPIGFVIYFQKNFYQGDLRFIDVEPEFRSKGWAYKLLDYAVKDLLSRGITKIELVTRTTNYPAQKLYTRYGFTEKHRNEGFVYYEYLAPSV